jgi:hypothetical protein
MRSGTSATAARASSIILPELHGGQIDAYWALLPHRFRALRCGRRFGKTEFAKAWVAQGLVEGQECAWLAPQHMMWSEGFSDLMRMLGPIVMVSSRSDGVIRFSTGGRLDFYSLENPIVGRGKRYQRMVIDEAAFAKNGDNRSDDSVMAIWEKALKPTLLDFAGEVLVCSNSSGKNPDNFFFNICSDSQYGFKEFHATTLDNPLLPKRLLNESINGWESRRAQFLDDLKRDNDPLVYAQEYLAEFVDWSGAAFFSREKLLVDNLPVAMPPWCEYVFAVIDTASKTGTDNDGTAVTFFAVQAGNQKRLVILDWDIAQIEGALLETWLPRVFKTLEALARECRGRGGWRAFIEDKNSGTILLQQARRRGWPVAPTESKLTALGKDERAISVSGYVHRGLVKYADRAFNKMTTYKQHSRNHLLDQVESFRIADPKSDREDDLLDTFCYGIALALGNFEGF